MSTQKKQNRQVGLEMNREGLNNSLIKELGEEIVFLRNKVLELERQNEVLTEEITTKLHNLSTSVKRQEIDMYWFHYTYNETLPKNFYENALRQWYYLNTGETLDFNKPQNFNQKIQWLKLYHSTPEMTDLANKIVSKQLVAELIGSDHIVPTLGSWKRYDEIDFSSLPKAFALKTNHGSQWNKIVVNKDTINHTLFSQQFQRWLSLNYAFMNGFEMHYAPIPPRIFAEEYFPDFKYDYKFNCFHGKPHYLRLIHMENRAYSSFYDLNLKRLPNFFTRNDIQEVISPPPYWTSLLRDVTKLAKDFPFVRIDFYCTQDNYYFGEFTFTPMSGLLPFAKPKYNREWGEMIHLERF